MYCGETARALWDRTEEHLNALRSRQKSSFLWKHWANHHNTEEAPDFSVKPLKTHKYSTERQICEALQIDKYKCDQLMNSKKEYGSNSVIRQTVLYRDQTAEETQDQPRRASRQEDKEAGAQTDKPSCSAERDSSKFETQYAQRAKAKRQADTMIRAKRPREQADPIELGLSRRPAVKVVKKQDRNDTNERSALNTLDVMRYWRTAARGATSAKD